MSRYLDPKFAALQAYTPGEQPKERKYIKLNTNECPYPPSPLAVKAASKTAHGLNLYSDPACMAARAPLARALGVQPEEVFCGNGSDEILTILFAALCPRGAAYADVTYSFYPVLAQLCGVDAKVIPLREDFTLAPEDYNGLGRTIFIANPNAPTGLALSRKQIEGILQANPGAPVVIDEAYVDFGAESAVPLLAAYSNLVVVGTFSKSRQLAGGRFGYAAARREIIEDMDRIKYSFNPYNVNSVTLAAAAACVEDAAYFESCRQKVMATREHALEVLRGMGFEAADSLANFVFVRHPAKSGEALYTRLRAEGVLVRWWPKPRIENHLRITIGTDAEMQALFDALEKVFAVG